MDFQDASEILQVFKSPVLKQNHVKKITEFGIAYQVSDGVKPRYRNAEYLIDKMGKVYEYKVYSGINIIAWLKFQYDNNGELLSIKQLKHINKDGESWHNLTKNEVVDDILIEEIEGCKVYSTHYLNGKIKTRKVVDGTGRFISHNEYKNNVIVRSVSYSENNKIISDYRFDTYGKPTTKRENEYDKNDNLIRFLYTSKSGEITTDLKMTYDENNNLIESVDIPKNVYSILYNVDLDKWAEQGNETESYRHIYTYSPVNLLIEHQIFLACQYGIGYEYEYLLEG